MNGGFKMEKYLLNMPKEMKTELTDIAKRDGYSLNAQILFILSGWLKNNKQSEGGELTWQET